MQIAGVAGKRGDLTLWLGVRRMEPLIEFDIFLCRHLVLTLMMSKEFDHFIFLFWGLFSGCRLRLREHGAAASPRHRQGASSCDRGYQKFPSMPRPRGPQGVMVWPSLLQLLVSPDLGWNLLI